MQNKQDKNKQKETTTTTAATTENTGSSYSKERSKNPGKIFENAPKRAYFPVK